MKYSNAIGAALNGLFKTTVAQQPQSGALDALKIAQGESTINQNNASISKNNAEAQRLNDERLLYSDDALRGALTSALTGDNQADRTNALLRLTPLVKNPEQVTDAIGKSIRQLWANNVMTGQPDAAQRFNTLNAAEGGKLYSDVGSTGLTLNQGTGNQFVANQQLFDNNLAKTNSEIGKNKALSAKYRADEKMTLLDINNPNFSIQKDNTGALFYVDKTGRSPSKPVLRPDGTPFKGSSNNTIFKTDMNGNLWALDKNSENPDPKPVMGDDGRQFVSQTGALIQMRANALDIAGNEAVAQLELIEQMPASEGLSAFQEATTKGGDFLKAFKNVTARQLTSEDAVAYEAAMSGLGMEVARLANAGYAPTDGQIKAITDGATVKEGKDTVFTSTLKFLKLAQNARAALEAAKIGTPEQRKQREEILKKLEKYPKPVQFYNAYKRSESSRGEVINAFKDSQQAKGFDRDAYNDYVQARKKAYSLGNWDLVRKMDLEAKKDGLIR